MANIKNRDPWRCLNGWAYDDDDNFSYSEEFMKVYLVEEYFRSHVPLLFHLLPRNILLTFFSFDLFLCVFLSFLLSYPPFPPFPSLSTLFRFSLLHHIFLFLTLFQFIYFIFPNKCNSFILSFVFVLFPFFLLFFLSHTFLYYIHFVFSFIHFIF